MDREQISLLKFRGQNSTLFTGRTQGNSAREELDLDEKDSNESNYEFLIPRGTTSFNPSFFLGLLFNSIKNLGIENFNKKYTFSFEDAENRNVIKVLNANIEDGKRNAINALKSNSSLNRFI